MKFGAGASLVVAVLVVNLCKAEEWRPILKQLSRQSRRADGGSHSHHQGGGGAFAGRTGRAGGGARRPQPPQHARLSRPRPQELPRRGRDGHEAAPAAPVYGGPKEEEPTPVDLHNKEFCVDVSTFDPVTWVEREGQECETVFEKSCEEKEENVCADVTETTCKVEPYTVCEMGLEPQNKVSTMLSPKLFVEKTCTQGKKEIPHTKLLPECRNVTKQNCVTLWETDADGKQVWAGTDACEPVTWQECKLVPKDVKFIVPEIKCEPKQELWYHEPEEVNETEMTNTYTCKTESTTDCTSTTRPDCKTISWQECREVPVTNCQAKSVHVPMQEKQHRKKCLLPDEGKDEAPPSYGAPPPPPPSYGAPSQDSYSSPVPPPPTYSG